MRITGLFFGNTRDQIPKYQRKDFLYPSSLNVLTKPTSRFIIILIPIKIIGIKIIGITHKEYTVSGRCFDEDFHKGTIWSPGGD